MIDKLQGLAVQQRAYAGDIESARRTYLNASTLVTIPAGLAFCTGAFLGLCVGMVGLAIEEAWPGFLNVSPWRLALAVAGITFVVSWFAWVGFMFLLYFFAEGWIKPPARRARYPVRARFIVTGLNDNHRGQKLIDLRAEGEQVIEFARRRILLQRTPSERKMKDIFGGNVNAFRDFRDDLIAAGLADWRVYHENGDPAEEQGWDLTEPGWSYFSQVVGQNRAPSIPLPQGANVLKYREDTAHARARTKEKHD